ncbi:MAG TPA: hypothetical protein VF185_03975 [Patescibacteria group bacterium]
MVIELSWNEKIFGRKINRSRKLKQGEVVQIDVIERYGSKIAEVKAVDDETLLFLTRKQTEVLKGNEINTFGYRFSMWDMKNRNVVLTWYWGKER